MKKFKLLLPCLLALVMLLSIPFAAACKKKDKTDKPSLESLTLNTDGVTKQFFIGGEFTSEGLAVTANIQHTKPKELEQKVLTAEEYTIDSSAFDSTKAGECVIKVSYTYGEQTAESSYSVEVFGQLYEGLEVTLASDVSDTVTLSRTRRSATIDVSKIVVKEVDENGIVIDTPISDYTAELYNKGEKIELTDNKATVDEGGAYQIWASKPSSKIQGYTLRGFARIYVMNALRSLEVNQEDAVFTQPAGRVDVMSPNWTYTLTYANDKTEQLTASDVVVNGVNPKVGSTVAKNVTITYSSVNAKGEAVSVETTQAVTVTGEYKPNMLEFNVNNYDIESNIVDERYIYTATAKDGTHPEDGSLGSLQLIVNPNNGDATIAAANSLSDNFDMSFGTRLTLNGTATKDGRNVKLNLVGSAIVTVVAASNSSSSERIMALFDSEFIPIDETFGATTIARHEFVIDAAGTYYLGSMNAGMNIYYILVEYTD